MQLIAEKKAAINKEIDGHSKETVTGFQGRDLLTLLIKANMSAEVPENQRLTDDEVLARTLRLMSSETHGPDPFAEVPTYVYPAAELPSKVINIAVS